MRIPRTFAFSLVLPLLTSAPVRTTARPALGTIVPQHASEMSPEGWQVLKELGMKPEILLQPVCPAWDKPFDFSRFEEDLRAYEEHGFRVAVSIAPHIRCFPWRPQTDENGREWTDRQNLFDPEFLSQWSRLHREFVETCGEDPLIERVYVAPPSYFGEIEYYMGDSWANLKILSYGPLARTRFLEWLKERYGSVEKLAAAWGEPVGSDSWDSVTLPRPRRDAICPHKEKRWLDFMAWRSQYLTEAVSSQTRILAEGGDFEVGLKFSSGDYSAVHGTDCGALVSSCSDLPKLVLHQTNAHSLSDLVYGANLVRRYRLKNWVGENDGNRYGRDEIAKIVLNLLLTGVDEFHFSYHGHLLDRSRRGRRRTETAYAVADAAALLARYDLEFPRKEIAFLHSNLTCFVRAPHYRNRDVSRVYDAALSNGDPQDIRAFDWARYLNLPDVIGEQLVLEGDLKGRRVLIIPNSSITVLPDRVHEVIRSWVRRGGVLVLFGAEGFGTFSSLERASGDKAEAETGTDWERPPVTAGEAPLSLIRSNLIYGEFDLDALAHQAAPVWESPLPAPWKPVLVDATGRVALAARALGEGKIIHFPAPVSRQREKDSGSYYETTVPLLIRTMAEEAGCRFSHELLAEGAERKTLTAALALGYSGTDRQTGKHVFIGGAYDESMPCVRLVPDSDRSGPAELVLVDLPRVIVKAEAGKGPLTVFRSRPSQYELYKDPTAAGLRTQTHIPVVRVEFELPQTLILEFAGK